MSSKFKQELAEALQGRRCADIALLLNEASRLMAEEQEEAEGEVVDETFVRRALEHLLSNPYLPMQ